MNKMLHNLWAQFMQGMICLAISYRTKIFLEESGCRTTPWQQGRTWLIATRTWRVFWY